MSPWSWFLWMHRWEVNADVARLHDTLRHIPSERLERMLQTSGANAVEPPDPGPRTSDACNVPGEVLGRDGFVWQHPSTQKVYLFAMIVDERSRHFVLKLLQEAGSEAELGNVVFVIESHMFRVLGYHNYGMPKMVRVGAFGCFWCGKTRSCLVRHGIEVYLSSSEALWQQGRGTACSSTDLGLEWDLRVSQKSASDRFLVSKTGR